MNEQVQEQKKRGVPGYVWLLIGCGGLALLVPFIAIIAAIAVPSLLAAKRSSLETNAVGSLRAYASAQAMYHRNDWDGDGDLEYADDFTKLSTTTDPGGMQIMLIDSAFASAKGSAGIPKHGYLFMDMASIGGIAIDWKNDYAICATPATYGRTGYRTFIISTNGTVFGMDLGCSQFVTDYPESPATEGWIIAE